MLSRLLGALLSGLLLVVWGGIWLRKARKLGARVPYKCTCGYDPAGLPPAGCPECGRSLDPGRLIESALDGLKAKLTLFLARTSVVFAAILAGLGSNLIEIAQIVRRGDLAFVPGYSLFDDAAVVWIGVVLIPILLWLVLFALLVASAGRIVRAARTRLYDLAGRQRGLSPLLSPTPSSGGPAPPGHSA
jgi:hypothetical protein